MPNARTVSMSLDHLVAEMIAFPWVSKVALRRPLENLHRQLDGGTRQLWRTAERYFVSRFPHVGIDELIAIRNRCWFGSNRSDDGLHRYLTHCSTSWLIPHGPWAEPRLPDNSSALDNRDAAARRAWRWLTFAMPGDLLLAGLVRDGQGPVRCQILTPFVTRMLRSKGFAETHLHMGAGLDYPSAWASAVNVVGRSPGSSGPSMSYDAFASPGADHGEGRNLANWLVRAATARYLLAAYLNWGTSAGDLNQFLQDRDIWDSIRLPASHRDLLTSMLSDLARGSLHLSQQFTRDQRLQRSFVENQIVYNALTKVALMPLPRRLDDVQRLDPLWAFYPVSNHAAASCQLRFLWHGIEHLREHPDDRLFARLFWQVERIRCQVYRHCIQRPLTPGLMNFVRVYERKAAIIGPLEHVELESCGVLSGVGRGLTSLEIRTQPAKRKNDQLALFQYLDDTLATLRRDADWRNVECGLVLHFLKVRGSGIDRGLPSSDDLNNNADPSLPANTARFRWQDYYQRNQSRADALVHALEHDVTRLKLLRGIDVCRDEHGVPTWVVAPLFHRVRRRVERAMARVYTDRGIVCPPLRTTAHVGEDFVHLATGLRYMDEAMVHLPLKVGDRIGHGLALGTDPLDWAKRQHCLLMPREDRWLDLVWERVWHGRQGTRFSSSRKTYVEDQLTQLSNEIFGENDWLPSQAVQLWKMLYDGSIRELGFPNRLLTSPPVGRPTSSAHVSPELQRRSSWRESPKLRSALARYLTSGSVYRRCREVIWVDASDDGPAIAELQRCVRKCYAENGITIEVNPISNLMVGDLTDLTTHPLWRLAPGLDQEYGETLRMCVGSDDPLPFATTLPEEYQFLYDSLLLADRSHAAARVWLDEIRDMGLESRFTQPV